MSEEPDAQHLEVQPVFPKGRRRAVESEQPLATADELGQCLLFGVRESAAGGVDDDVVEVGQAARGEYRSVVCQGELGFGMRSQCRRQLLSRHWLVVIWSPDKHECLDG